MTVRSFFTVVTHKSIYKWFQFPVILLKVLRDADLSEGQGFSSGKSTIHVMTGGGGEVDPKRSITFQAFESFGCILDERENWYSIV